MVLEGGAVKVMDFGIAKVIEALNQTNTQSVGTLQYMSPEQIDAHTIDHRSDLYCLGLIFYELCAGRPPFQSASPRQLLNLQCTAEPPPLPEEVRAGLPRGVEQLLFQLLEKAPEDRPYLAEDIIERLEPFQSAAPAKGGARAPSTPRASTTQRTPSKVTASKATDRASAPDRASVPAVSAPAKVDTPARVAATEPEPTPASAPKEPPVRADTIALLDRVGKPREVPAKVAVGIVIALSAIAGIAAYVLRASAPPADTPSVGPTAAITAPAPSSRDKR
jgi:serine/threonine-protein kinase